MQPCCGDNFECVHKEENCVYKGSITHRDDNFCNNQFSSCYYCCLENTCKIKDTCNEYFRKNTNNSYLVFLGIMLNFFLAIAIYVLYWADNKLRLLRCKNAKLKNQTIGMSESSVTNSKGGSVYASNN